MMPLRTALGLGAPVGVVLGLWTLLPQTFHVEWLTWGIVSMANDKSLSCGASCCCGLFFCSTAGKQDARVSRADVIPFIVQLLKELWPNGLVKDMPVTPAGARGIIMSSRYVGLEGFEKLGWRERDVKRTAFVRRSSRRQTAHLQIL
jgi:hypothetical protein